MKKLNKYDVNRVQQVIKRLDKAREAAINAQLYFMADDSKAVQMSDMGAVISDVAELQHFLNNIIEEGFNEA
jgi:hypothetical protein